MAYSVLRNAEDFNSKYPQILNQIKAEIRDSPYTDYDLGIIKNLNNIIERFKRLEPTWFVGFEDLELTENDILNENKIKF